MKKGFTLLEVMVALLIIALVLSAMSMTISRQAKTAHYLDQKMAAHWVAMNVISRLTVELPLVKAVPSESGRMDMFHQFWFWTAEMMPVGDTSIERITVSVAATEKGAPVFVLQSAAIGSTESRQRT